MAEFSQMKLAHKRKHWNFFFHVMHITSGNGVIVPRLFLTRHSLGEENGCYITRY